MQQFGFIARSAIFVIFLSFVMTGNVQASFDAEIAFANQIIDEIKTLKTETKSVGISQPHRGHLVNRLNVARYFVKAGRIKLQNNKPYLANYKFRIAKYYMTRYIRPLNRKVGKGHISAATARLLRPDARQIRRHLKKLIQGEIGNGISSADAGMDQNVLIGEIATLDGSGSSDPDGDPLIFQWTLLSQPPGSWAVLVGDQTATPTLTPDVTGSYVIELVVSDAKDSSSPDTVTVNASTSNTTPVADAGPDQTGIEGWVITLDGSGSSDADGDTLSFDWTLTTLPSGSAATLDSSTAVMPTFTADEAGIYEAELTVNDGQDDSDPDTVAINIENANTPPVANAGPDQSVFIGQIVQLDGSQSSDVDGDPLGWFWSFISVPAGSAAVLSDEFEVNPSFTVDVAGQYIVQLEVNDDRDGGALDSVIANAITPNTIPVADAGPDQSDFVGATIVLDGSASSDADSDPLTYSWSLTAVPSGSIAALDNAAVVSPSFVLDLPGNYVVQLVVNDEQANSAPDEIIVSTLNSRPAADAGQDQAIVIGNVVQLNGASSSDADNDSLTYSWSIIGQPEGSNATLEDPTSATPGITPDEIGFWVFQLVVNDGTLDSDPVSVSVQVDPVNNISINMTSPSDGFVTNQADIYIVGSLNHTGTLAINGDSVTIESDLSFAYWVTLSEGNNVFNLAASDAVGTTDNLSITITLDTSSPASPNSGFILVGLPDASDIVTITGEPGAVEPFTVVFIVNDWTGEVFIVTADADGAFSAPVTGMQGDTYVILSEDEAGNQSGSIEVDDGSLPDDPQEVAPELNPTLSTNHFDSTAFLYTGSNPIQTGVTADTIDPARSTVIRGRVMDKQNNPLPGVKVSIKDHPEYGQTLTRTDGQFDLVVNGGSQFVLNYDKTHYLPAQRHVKTEFNGYFHADDVVLIKLDPSVTRINLLSNAPMQVARGSVISDADGERQATLLIPQGTSAVMFLADGSTEPLTDLSIRFTEYTVGGNGPETMPGTLPSSSGYTYALEYSVDEVIAAGGVKVNGRDVQFNQNVISYTDNFLNLPTGTPVPVGFYDQEIAAWQPSTDGLIIEILSITDGLAILDVDGSGNPATPELLNFLEITDAERLELANLYSEGTTLWRVLTDHFSTGDFNFQIGFPAAFPPKFLTPEAKGSPQGEKPDKPKYDETCGCVIGVSDQTLGESEAIAGTDFRLHYQSSRTEGYLPNRTIKIQVTPDETPDVLKGVDVIVDVLGRRTEVAFTNAPGQTYEYTWDGFDAYGRKVNGNADIYVTLRYKYTPVYYRNWPATGGIGNPNAEIGASFNGFARSPNPSLRPTIIGEGRVDIGLDAFARYRTTQGANNQREFGLWSISPHHRLDIQSKDVFLGNGEVIRGSELADTIEALSGEDFQPIEVGQPLSQTWLTPLNLRGLTASEDGGFYLYGTNRIVKVDANGIITRVIGTGVAGFSGDGGPSENAQIRAPSGIGGIEFSDGSFYFTDVLNNRIRRVDSNGIISTVAGTGSASSGADGEYGLRGDGGPAVSADIFRPQQMVRGSDNSLIFLTYRGVRGTENLYYIRKITPDGLIQTLGGTGPYTPGLISGSVREATLINVRDLAIDRNDNLYLLSHDALRVIDPSGVIDTLGGLGNAQPDSGVALADVAFDWTNTIYSITLDQEDNLILASNRFPSQIFKVVNKRLSLMAGVNYSDSSLVWTDGLAAQDSTLGRPASPTVLKDDSVIFQSGQNVYRIKPAFNFTQTSGSYLITSPDGGEAYRFDAGGRHLDTLNALTGATLYSFEYSPDGLLTRITDAFGNVTEVTRDAAGSPLNIVSADGQTTALTLDADGYLASITNPLGDAVTMSYSAEGLMQSFRDKNQNTTTFQYLAGRLVDDLNPEGGGWTIERDENGFNQTLRLTSKGGYETVYQVDRSAEDAVNFTTTFSDGSTTTKTVLNSDETQSTWADGTTVTSRVAADSRFGLMAAFTGQSSQRLPSGLERVADAQETSVLTDANDPFSLTSLTRTRTLNGRNSTSGYDAASRSWTETSPENRTAIVQINAQGQPILSQITGFNSASYSYDSRGRLEVIGEGNGADGRVTTLTFYPVGGLQAGYLESIEDAENQITRFEYDALGRVIKQILPDLREITYTYDANGNLASLTPPGRPAHVFAYDGVDQETQYTPPGVTGIATPQTVYTYNLDKQLTGVIRPDGQQITIDYGPVSGLLESMTTPTGTYSYGYDPDSAQLTSITAPGGERLDYAYDGFLLTRSSAIGQVSGSVDRVYDNDFRIASRSIDGAHTIAFGYDGDSLLTRAGDLTISRETQKAGLISGSTLGSLVTSRSYNDFAEMDGFDASYNGASLYSTSYTRDRLGRITQKVETIDGTTTTTDYVYDPAGRLIGESTDGVSTSYAYDANGNRTHVNGVLVGTYDDQDRLNTYQAASYEYTDNGELLRKTESGVTTTYQYDVLGILRQVTLPGGMQIEYVIDGQNRRIGKKIDGNLVQGFLYKDQLNPIAELDGDNNIVARFIYGTKINVPDYMEKNGNIYRIISDHLGSPRLVVNTITGDIAQRIDYDTWGKITIDTNPGFQPFGFAGGLYDLDTKLTRYGARDYDPSTARWTSKDPIRFKSSDINLYGYATGDPVNMIDVDGRDPVTGFNQTMRELKQERLPIGNQRLSDRHREETRELLEKSLQWKEETQDYFDARLRDQQIEEERRRREQEEMRRREQEERRRRGQEEWEKLEEENPCP